MQFQDYYKTLGVERTDTQDTIKKAYRSLSKKFHPDRNDEKGAEDRFKEVNEAYEVIGDADKRKRYDQVGQGFHAGDDFRAPQGWQNVDFNFDFGQGGARGAPVGGGFSDFFETMFGGGAGGPAGGNRGGGRRARGPNPYAPRPAKGRTHEVEITISLEDAYRGATREVALDRTQLAPDGGRRTEKKSYTVKIPAGTTDGTKIRLAGQGTEGMGGGAAGDLLLKVKIAEHPRFELHAHDVRAKLALTPWEAALGTKVDFQTLDAEVKLTIPPGSQSGSKLRLKGKGLAKKRGPRGDLEVELQIKVPKELSDEERTLFEQLAEASEFDPRG